MSTVIRNGIVCDVADIDSAYYIVDIGLRSWALEQQHLLYAKYLYILTSRGIDESTAWKYLREDWMQMKRSEEKRPLVDSEFKIVFYPDRAFSILGHVYTLHDSWYQRLLENKGVSEYSYWDNADKPDNLSDEEWESRRKEWRTVLPENGIPAMHGFTIDVTDPRDPILFKDPIMEALEKLRNDG